jgi:hypothetical protein
MLWSDAMSRDASKGLASALICLGLVAWWLLGCPDEVDEPPVLASPQTFSELNSQPVRPSDCPVVCAEHGGSRYYTIEPQGTYGWQGVCVCVE